MVEYTYGIVKNKPGKCLFINFITDIAPKCDCLSYTESPIVNNIGSWPPWTPWPLTRPVWIS